MYWILFFSLFLSWGGEAQTVNDPMDQNALNQLEQQVQSLKESVFRTKTQIHELEEAVLRGKITGSKAFIDFENRAEGIFTFSSAEFFVDDQLVQRIQGEGTKNSLKQTRIFDKDLPSGEHTLRAKIQYRGNDQSIYKMFPYFQDHKFELETSVKFFVDYGKTTVVKLTALDRGYFDTDIRERLYLKTETLQDWGAEPPS